ncbi:MAG: hypothetical protein IK129_07600 [Deltaproteobacteria bacterium]|nr:hypothetical protein [Deltaproteobacteria bacterium]
MAEDNGYRYWTDHCVLIRTKGDKAQSLWHKNNKWSDWDWRYLYARIGDWKWRVDHFELTPEQAKKYVQDDYGLQDIPE